MKRAAHILISALLAMLMLSLYASASEPWVYYDPDAASPVIVSLYKARINEDCSLTVVFAVQNAGAAKAENFSITRASLTFGEYTFGFDNQVKGKKISAGKTKRYGVTIPASGVPEALNYVTGLDTCTYHIEYEYEYGEYWHTGARDYIAEKLYRR